MTKPNIDQVEFRRTLNSAFALPLIALVLLAAVLLWQVNSLLASTRLVARSDRVLTEVTEAQRLLIDLETGVRGYLLTGDNDFLDPYVSANSQINGVLDRLLILVSDDPEQATRLEQLQPAYLKWRDYATQVLALRQSNGDYLSVVRSRNGKNLMDQMRANLNAFIRTEEGLRNERSAAAQQAARVVIWSSIGLALLVGLGLALLTRRQLSTLAHTYGQALTAEQARADELDEQRERLRVTLASIGDAVMVASPDGTLTFLNAVAESVTGWGNDEAEGQDMDAVFNIINEHTRAPAVNPFERVVREGVVVGLANHTLLIRRDGTEVPIDDSAAPIKDREGSVIGVVLVFRDISEQKHAERARFDLNREIEAQRARLDNVIANVPGVVWEAWGQPDLASQRIDFVSNYVETMLGYTTEEWLSTPNFWLTIVHPDDRVGAAARATEAFRRGEPGINRFRWITRSGEVLWVESHSVIMMGEDGQPMGMRGVTLDISARMQAEQGRARVVAQQRFLLDASALLASSLEYEQTFEQLARRLVPAMADWCAVHILEPDETVRRLTIVHVDPVKTELARQRPDRYSLQPGGQHIVPQVLRTKQAEFYPAVPDDLLAETARDEQHLRLLRTLGFTSYMCVPMTARGRTLGTITLVTADSGRHFDTADLSVAEELGVRAALAIDNARLYRETRDAVRARDQFLSIASHELKTPITSLIGYADLLLRRAQRDGQMPERDQRAVRIISDQASRLNRLIAALLDLSRIETGQLSIERGEVALSALVDRLVRETQATLQTHHQLVWDLPAESLTISGDELRIEQVVQNLIQNAIKYSPAGGTITVRLGRDGEWAQLIVSDEGIGIPEHALPNLFKRFYRAPNTDEHHISGMGVGLFVVREIVQLHGGDIHVESIEGKGTTVTLLLPVMSSTELGQA